MKCYYRDRLMLNGDWTSANRIRIILSNNEYPENAAYNVAYDTFTDTTTIVVNWVGEDRRRDNDR